MSATVKVWDPLLRLFHWSLVTSFAVAWLSGGEVRVLHEWAGYAAAALVAFRVIYGLAGPTYARFGQFIRGPLTTAAYTRDVISRRERRYVGHNPLGALMVVTLLALMTGMAITGWLMTTDAFWGVEWVEELHGVLANVMLGLVVLHVAGVIMASLRHRENLIGAMITGRKRSPCPEDIT